MKRKNKRNSFTWAGVIGILVFIALGMLIGFAIWG